MDRGPWPVDLEGRRLQFSEYALARGELIQRLGEYCSFCESLMNASLAVEHVLPKRHHPERALDWDNFLLACVNCNSSKGSRAVTREAYFWPDRDNTARAFAYSAEGFIRPAPELTPEQAEVAKRTLALIGLDRLPTHNPKASDRRWLHRREAWGRAERAREALARHDSEAMRRGIVEQATALGFWSIWMTVFAADLDMRQRLVTAFAGTPLACFDAQTRLLPRPGGAL